MSKITTLRNEMDSITLQMIKLFKIRIDISKQIGDLKSNLGLEITDETREKALRNKVISLCSDIHLNKSEAIKFLNFLLCESIKIQNNNKHNQSIFLRAKDLETQGKKIIHMEIGEPDFPPPINIRKALSEIHHHTQYIKYGEPKGVPELRSAIANKILSQYHISDIDKNNIMICHGARFAIYLIMATVLDNEDEIIIIDPSWPAYKDCASNFGIKTRIIKTNIENNWNPDISEINSMINPNTKMIILNYPNNPTGKILNTDLQDQIIEIANENNLYVLSDEIYSIYAYKPWRSISTYKYKNKIVVQSFSKSHSMTGFRIGYVIASPNIISKMSKLQSLCLTNVSSPIQYVALKALYSDITNNSTIVKSRLNMIETLAKSIGLNFIQPNGALYIFVQLPDCYDSVKLANKLLDCGLAISPGTMFGNYKNFIRLSVCQDTKQLIEGMGILNNILNGES